MLRPTLTLLGAPILLAQALWVVVRAQRLPEAAGERTGVVGEGPPLRLLIVGNSSAAGVGVAHQSDALVGRLSARLAADRAVSWTVVARSGATAGSLLQMLEDVPDARFDVAVVALGVNDSKNGVPERTWRKNYATLLQVLEDRFGVKHICVSGLPPVGDFPLLPVPLRRVLGHRAVRFDQSLRDMAAARANVSYVLLDFEMDPTAMAADGFHPGPRVYDAWAGRVFAALQGQNGLEPDQ